MAESNFDEARRQLLEEQLICPHCTASNAPGKQHIELAPSGLALCSVCAHAWIPHRKDESL